MDRKERWLLQQLTSAVNDGDFTERDVLALLILLRRHSERTSPVHEFADFVAHRDKNRGIVKKYLRRIQRGFRGESSEASVDLPVFQVSEIRASFNRLFSRFGATQIGEERANQLTVCIITLLQSVEIHTDVPIKVRGFDVYISATQVALFGHATLKPREHVVGFPMLLARNNDYHGMNGFDNLMPFTEIAASFCSGNVFRIEQWRAS